MALFQDFKYNTHFIYDFSKYDFFLKNPGILTLLKICRLMCFQKTEGMCKEVVIYSFGAL